MEVDEYCGRVKLLERISWLTSWLEHQRTGDDVREAGRRIDHHRFC